MGKKHKHIPLTVCVVLFLLLTSLFFYISITVANEIPSVMEYDRSRLSSGITFSTFEKLTSKSYKEDLSVYAELNPVILDEIGEVKPVLVNENYFKVYGTHVSGSGITEQHIQNRTPAIVISNKTAMSISLDGNVIGKLITLYDKDFTIVGIYKKPDGFLHEISSDIYDRVYIPYTCYDDYVGISIDALAATKGTYSEKALPLLGLIETDTNFYIENDLAIKHDIIANFPMLFLSICSISITIICLKRLIRLMKSTSKKLCEEHENYNVKAIIIRNKGFIFARLLCAILLIGVPITLLIFFPIKLIIPQNYIPYDNIFDISHYLSIFKAELQMNNTKLYDGSLYINNLYSLSICICSVELLSLLFLLIMIKLSANNTKSQVSNFNQNSENNIV